MHLEFQDGHGGAQQQQFNRTDAPVHVHRYQRLPIVHAASCPAKQVGGHHFGDNSFPYSIRTDAC